MRERASARDACERHLRTDQAAVRARAAVGLDPRAHPLVGLEGATRASAGASTPRAAPGVGRRCSRGCDGARRSCSVRAHRRASGRRCVAVPAPALRAPLPAPPPVALAGLVSRASGEVLIDGVRAPELFARQLGAGTVLATGDGSVDVQFGAASAFALGPRSTLELRKFDQRDRRARGRGHDRRHRRGARAPPAVLRDRWRAHGRGPRHAVPRHPRQRVDHGRVSPRSGRGARSARRGRCRRRTPRAGLRGPRAPRSARGAAVRRRARPCSRRPPR